MTTMQIPPKDEEELALERLVFGDTENFEFNLKQTENFFDSDSEEVSDEHNSDASDSEVPDDDDMFFIDDDGDDMEVDNSGEEDDDDEASEQEDNDEEDAWNDSEDDMVKISLTSTNKLKKLRKVEQDDMINGKAYINRLRSQFEKIYPKPTWVEKLTQEGDEDVDSEDEAYNQDDVDVSTGTNELLKVLQSTDKFMITKQLKLISPNKLSISRLKDANQAKRSKSGIQALSFHHASPLLLTGGFDKTVRVYHIDGQHNNLITSLFLKNCPIYSSCFSPLKTKDDKNLIFIGGRRKYMNKWDLNNDQIEKISRMYGFEKFQKSMEYFKISSHGKFIGLIGSSGYCNILNGLNGQFLFNFKIEGNIIDFEFSLDEQIIIIINSHGEVWEFELNANQLSSNTKPLRRWNDDSGIGITKIKLGGKNSRWLAIGSNNGVVNLYDRTQFPASNNNNKPNVKPFKTIENLITTISTLEFSPDGQLLVIASRGKRDALRVVQLPTGSVYSNWPTSGTPLGKVLSVAFSPNNQMLAIGNEAGKVTLWRLNHY